MNGAFPIAAPARPARFAGSRCAWLLIRDPGEARALEFALAAEGWQVGAVAHTLGALHTLIGRGDAAPALIVTGVRFDDGDALRLIRSLARRGWRSALYIASRQQRAVIKAAVALAEACGVSVAGFTERPADAAAIARHLAGYVPPPDTAPQRRTAPVPLGKDELLELLDRGALHPWMQPKLRIASGEITGFEALLRANDAEGRLVMPDRLVSALTAHGLLDQATMHMARQTVEFVAACLAEGMAVSASVNVSMQSLSNLAFCQELERTAAHVDLDPSWITIEITETDAMGDMSTVIENTARIRMHGFNLSIDDFGTAYSSLMQLSRIPFSELKIERAFVSGIDRDAGKQAIVRSCAQLGRSLGLHVVAEGVETREEYEAVGRLGCTEVQGWLIGKPMPVAQAVEWLRALPDQRFAV
jgi:EAL domain-containing protein (putative c-di-GMP-specific phosphodiesterase class I)